MAKVLYIFIYILKIIEKFLQPYLVYKLAFLVSGAKLEELLDDIVAKYVGHQAVGRRQDFLEDQLLLSRSSTF